MKTIDLVQNSKEWHEFRKTRLGASCANIIMGVSEFQTPREYWKARRKYIENPDVLVEDEPNFIQAKGHRAEPKLRSILELQLGFDFPAVVVINDAFPAFMASLDGWCEELQATAEFKLVGKDNFEFVRDQKKCLPQYYPQVQQQLMLTNAKKCYFMVGMEDPENKGKLLYTFCVVERDQDYIEKQLIPTVHAFIDCLNNNVPPKLMKDDTLEQNEEELELALHRYKLMLAQQDEVNDMVEKTKAEIFKMLKHTKVNCNGIMLYDITAKDGQNIDYKKFIEDQKLAIPEKYISVKKGAKSKKIVFPKVVETEEKPVEEMIVKGASIPDPADPWCDDCKAYTHTVCPLSESYQKTPAPKKRGRPAKVKA